MALLEAQRFFWKWGLLGPGAWEMLPEVSGPAGTMGEQVRRAALNRKVPTWRAPRAVGSAPWGATEGFQQSRLPEWYFQQVTLAPLLEKQ